MSEIVARAVAVGDAALPADHMFVFIAARWATVFSLQHMSQIVSIGGDLKKTTKKTCVSCHIPACVLVDIILRTKIDFMWM